MDPQWTGLVHYLEPSDDLTTWEYDVVTTVFYGEDTKIDFGGWSAQFSWIVFLEHVERLAILGNKNFIILRISANYDRQSEKFIFEVIDIIQRISLKYKISDDSIKIAVVRKIDVSD